MGLVTNLYTAATPEARSEYRRSVAAFNRPANTTAYAVNTVISNSTATARALSFEGTGRSGCIKSVYLHTSEPGAVDYELLVFHEEPTNFIDGAALALTTSDLRHLLGTFTFNNLVRRPLAAGYATATYKADVGSLSVGSGVFLAPPDVVFASVTGTLFGLLVCRTVHTPTSNSLRYDIQLGIHTGRAFS